MNVYWTLDNIPRTNIAVEGWNNRFTQISGIKHPGFLVFVNQLKNEQQKMEDDIEISTAGVQKHKKSFMSATMNKFGLWWKN